jgi:hypothetical protein
MKLTTLTGVVALTLGALSGPLAAAPAVIDIGAAFAQATAGQDDLVMIRHGGDDRREARDDRREDRRDRRDDRREDRRDRNDDRSDDDHGDDSWDDDDDDSGRDEPRIPGGSGCDDPEDILEHPECSL